MGKQQVDSAKPRLCLYGAEGARSTQRAYVNLNRVLAALGLDALDVEFVDVLRDPQRTFEDGVLVTPTLIIHTDGKKHVLVGTIEEDEPLRHILSERRIGA